MRNSYHQRSATISSASSKVNMRFQSTYGYRTIQTKSRSWRGSLRSRMKRCLHIGSRKLGSKVRPAPTFFSCSSFLVDWRLRKPKMHQPGIPDPAPGSGPFRSDVLCGHDGLVHATQGRVKINSAVGPPLPFLISLFTIRTLGLLLFSGPISYLGSCSSHSRPL